MSPRRLTSRETRFLREIVDSEYRECSIRLREGEYQHDLAKEIASFHLELDFPDVKDIIRRSYGEAKVEDVQFRRKIQTILKKMEKNGVVKILPKKKPWELQRYGLLSFKFRDVENSRVKLAADQEIEEMKGLLESVMRKREGSSDRLSDLKIYLLTLIMVLSYIVVFWNLLQPMVDSLIFIPAFCLAVACALILGKMLSYR